jgi:hypothetical protein
VLEVEFAHRAEVLGVLRVRQRVAALDVIDADLVESLGQQQLVLQREVHALALAAVAERGVVDADAAHGVSRERKNPEAVLRGRVRQYLRPTPFTRW